MVRMDPEMTEIQRIVYAAALALLKVQPYPPTFAEVARKAGVGESRAYRAICRLVELGFLKFDPKAKRSLSKGKPVPRAKKLLA